MRYLVFILIAVSIANAESGPPYGAYQEKDYTQGLVDAAHVAGVQLDKLPALAVDGQGNYDYVRMDRTGRVLFKCLACDARMCLEMACKLTQQEKWMDAKCECVKKQKDIFDLIAEEPYGTRTKENP